MENIKKEHRQNEARIEQLRLEVSIMEDSKQQAELQQRVCYKQLRRLNNRGQRLRVGWHWNVYQLTHINYNNLQRLREHILH